MNFRLGLSYRFWVEAGWEGSVELMRLSKNS